MIISYSNKGIIPVDKLESILATKGWLLDIKLTIKPTINLRVGGLQTDCGKNKTLNIYVVASRLLLEVIAFISSCSMRLFHGNRGLNLVVARRLSPRALRCGVLPCAALRCAPFFVYHFFGSTDCYVEFLCELLVIS